MNRRQKLEHEFENGSTPKDLDGFYRGRLEMIIPKTFPEYLASFMGNIYVPWKGKQFYKKEQQGDNILPSYTALFGIKGEKHNGTFHAFPFKTSISKGLHNAKNVFQLNYNISSNPGRVKTVIDELVESPDRTFLGKAYVVNGRQSRLIAYFKLIKHS